MLSSPAVRVSLGSMFRRHALHQELFRASLGEKMVICVTRWSPDEFSRIIVVAITSVISGIHYVWVWGFGKEGIAKG